MKWLSGSVFFLLLGLSGCVEWLDWFAPTETDPSVLAEYLRGSSGPYRGQVIDAKTKQPIEGAVVVAVWYRHVYMVVDRKSVYYNAREVVTDRQGYFEVDAPDIERWAPTKTKFPVFTIFKPGYGYFEGSLSTEAEMFDRKNKSLLRVVELESINKLSKYEQGSRLPADLRIRDVPEHRIARYLKTLREHQQNLGS